MPAALPSIAFFEPRIPENTGNAIRLSAVTGAPLRLVEPLGFELEDSKLRRAGLDYHDLANVTVHPDLDAMLDALPEARVFAFTARAGTTYTDVAYEPGDILLFGPEPTGLPQEVMDHPRVTSLVRIPMLASRRSLNLANCASIVIYEAARQLGFGDME
ncbi:tRNA (cytidine(34)-2'-O)-methyltransferase [Demequina rhizosphaerae]|uniref:tRNA (cytidine(34)-2'-O)-methyltransferase n=1 Tax=Demequina rhizosphaerae TaxID=1638985 RepID=UPI00078578FE|nr:tRNA (cytidine(34)-2'-O)-methyltransferase [Demequina rhizosphaerae]